MSESTPNDLGARLIEVRGLAQALAARHPGLQHYEYILERVGHAEALSDDRATFEALQPLGVFAAREFDGAEGEYAQLADAIFALVFAAQKRAGLPDF